MSTDGLNSLKYSVDSVTEHRLYTLVTVDVKEAILQYESALMFQEGSTSMIQEGSMYDITAQSSTSID